jgi:hypothetical protein
MEPDQLSFIERPYVVVAVRRGPAATAGRGLTFVAYLDTFAAVRGEGADKQEAVTALARRLRAEATSGLTPGLTSISQVMNAARLQDIAELTDWLLDHASNVLVEDERSPDPLADPDWDWG